MTQKLDQKYLVSFQEMLMADSTQVDALTQRLVEKEIIVEGMVWGSLCAGIFFFLAIPDLCLRCRL
jgi:hypothetical protein